MPFHEAVGVLVVAAEHNLVGVVPQQAYQGVEVPGGAALPDEDVHTGVQFVQGFFHGETFMVGGDAGGDIGPGVGPPETRGVPIHGFAQAPGGGDLGHDVGVPGKHPGVVHHFAEIPYVGALQQEVHVGGGQESPGRFEGGGGDAARGAEVEMEGN